MPLFQLRKNCYTHTALSTGSYLHIHFLEIVSHHLFPYLILLSIHFNRWLDKIIPRLSRRMRMAMPLRGKSMYMMGRSKISKFETPSIQETRISNSNAPPEKCQMIAWKSQPECNFCQILALPIILRGELRGYIWAAVKPPVRRLPSQKDL